MIFERKSKIFFENRIVYMIKMSEGTFYYVAAERLRLRRLVCHYWAHMYKGTFSHVAAQFTLNRAHGHPPQLKHFIGRCQEERTYASTGFVSYCLNLPSCSGSTPCENVSVGSHSDGPDQPVHSHCLIRTLAVRSQNS